MERLLAYVAVVVCMLGMGTDSSAAPVRAVGMWSFDGDLLDTSGHGNDGHAVLGAGVFAEGRSGRGLVCGESKVVVMDSPGLRLAPGLRIECWVKLTSIGRSWQEIVIKEGEYQLRLDPLAEGGQFSFFAYLGGWEPRVKSTTVPKPGEWYHVVAGWDGEEVWLEVNGDAVREARTGHCLATDAPIEIGNFDGILDGLRIDNPRAEDPSVGRWRFDGNREDSSGNGHDAQGDAGVFVPGRSGQALRLGDAEVMIPSHADVALAPGFRLDCTVYVDEAPTAIEEIVVKDGEYMLRVNPQQEGGDFGFFVHLKNGWEPRARSGQRVQAGVWYHIIAGWDGFEVTLEVNGRCDQSGRRGMPAPTDNPVRVGGFGGTIDELRIENPRMPVLRTRRLMQEQALLRMGRPERLTVSVFNAGLAANGCDVRLILPEGIRCLDGPLRRLGILAMGAEQTVSWMVQSDAVVRGVAEIELTGERSAPFSARHALTFFPAEGIPAMPLPPEESDAGVTYYVDGISGDNAADGTSAATAWRDFSRINGTTLGAGDRLLIRRGSMINQELQVSASGTAERWAEIGVYGAGPRPVIRRNWDIADRCVLVRDPDFLRIRSLVVCYAAKGLVVAYTRGGHEGLLIEDCIAHHIEGLYRPNAHGIPEWRDREGPGGDGLGASAGIAISGASATGLTMRDCEMYQCSWGYFVKGHDVMVDRVYCHDSYVRNTSPHPVVVQVRRCVMQNCVLDASGWHASAGTMGIMLGSTDAFLIRNCTFRNMPDAGNHDQGGIDFENHGNGNLIEHCTFQNNAGAAIEVLGLKSPQATNIEIRDSRFIQNNWADKLGPAEIFIWGRSADPDVCCSTGWIHDNGYVTLPNVQFYVNEAPEMTRWTLADNRPYDSVAALEAAMPFNGPPRVDAGADVHTADRSVHLSGRVEDDGRPQGGALTVRWEVFEGAGEVAFENPGEPATKAVFGAPGDYVLRLVGDDGELWLSDMVTVHVLAPGASLLAGWEFNEPLNKEGWSEVNPGTKLQHWENDRWPTRSHPVKYVAGGYYILAVEDSSDAHILSADRLGVELTGREGVVLRFQNHTPATRMRVRFTTAADAAWDEAKSRVFQVVPNDTGPRTYTVDMAGVRGWAGRLRQLRLDLATGTPLTGTCRFDYIWIVQRQ